MTNSDMPMNRCSLNTSGASTMKLAASPRKVTMCCAQVISKTIMWPSMCDAETKIDDRPSSKVSKIHTITSLSPAVVTARRRALPKRRASRIRMPARHRPPITPPAAMATPCFRLCDTPSVSHTQTGVSRPAAWPNSRPMMPMWNRILPKRRLPRCSSWLESDFHVYCSRSKRIRLPSKKTASAMYG